MSCAPGAPTFRLLDAYVGWDPREIDGLIGVDDPAGLRLARLGPDPGAPSRQDLLPWFPDPRLAPGHDCCAWYLLAGSALLRRGACGGDWVPVWPAGCAPELPYAPVAIAAAGPWLAVAGADGVRVWYREGEQLVAVLPAPSPRLVALTAAGEAYVATGGSTDLWRYAPGGAPRGVLRTGLPGRIDGLRVGRDRHLWLLTEDDAGPRIWRARPDGTDVRPATPAELSAALPSPSTLAATWEDGFCLRETAPDGDDVDACFSWAGEPLPGHPPAPAEVRAAGELLTFGIDSGISRCRWHRVSLDADVPPATAVAVAVAVTEEVDAEPESGDWQEAPPGALDFLVDQPPGRYLHLRLRLSGDGADTPVVRRIRLDFPRATSADLLPAAFRQDPAAEDFTERFLSLFDASLAGIDRVIERHPALLDPHGVPDEALPWLGGLLGLAFEAGWDAGTRRALLAAAPELYRRRGTPWALREAVRIIFGVEPVIEELARERSWLRVGERGRLGVARLFGRSRARFRAGTSALSSAPLRTAGDPYADPLSQHAYRFRVSLPPRAAVPVDETALRRLIQSQAPAHTAGTVRSGGLGWVVGIWSAVGIDTAFVALPAPVLGAGPADPTGEPGRGRPVRLGRSSVLATSRQGPHRAMAVGERTTVGVESVSW